MSLSQLIRIAPPPATPIETGSTKKWRQVERRIGTPLPTDYKNFIDRYGTGCFNNLVIPYNPFAKSETVNLIQALDAHHHANRQTRRMGDPSWSAVYPFDLFPAADGVLPWGTTANFGEIFLWQVSGPPETWVTIAYNLRNGEYEVWKLPFTTFLAKLLMKEIESVVLCGDFPFKPEQLDFIPEAF
jgi:hypothetical protein